MALSRYLLNELFNDAYDPLSHLYDQNFGLGLVNDDLIPRRPVVGVSVPLHSGYLRHLRHQHPEDSGISSITNQKDQFKVNLDVQQFKPEEIAVKVTDDFLVVEGKHEERQDKHGYVSRQFSRRYKLPKDINVDAITSNISSDGILSVAAPKKTAAIAGERQIPVIHTNKPAIKQTQPQGSSNQEKMES